MSSFCSQDKMIMNVMYAKLPPHKKVLRSSFREVLIVNGMFQFRSYSRRRPFVL